MAPGPPEPEEAAQWAGQQVCFGNKRPKIGLSESSEFMNEHF